MRAQFKLDRKIMALFPLTAVQNLFQKRSYGTEVEGRDLGTL